MHIHFVAMINRRVWGGTMIRRNSKWQRIMCVLLSGLLTACAASREAVVKNGYMLDGLKICRNVIKDRELVEKYSVPVMTGDIGAVPSKAEDEEREYAHALQQQMTVRRLSFASCENMVDEQNSKIAAGIALGILAVGAAAAAANNYNNGYNNYSPTYASGYAWDQFYGSNGYLQWRCRSTSSGQFSNDYNCAGRPKFDSTWPAK